MLLETPDGKNRALRVPLFLVRCCRRRQERIHQLASRSGINESTSTFRLLRRLATAGSCRHSAKPTMNQVDLASHAARPEPLRKLERFLGRGARPLEFTRVGISCGQAGHAHGVVTDLRMIGPFRAALLQDRERGPGMPEEGPGRSASMAA